MYKVFRTDRPLLNNLSLKNKNKIKTYLHYIISIIEFVYLFIYFIFSDF